MKRALIILAGLYLSIGPALAQDPMAGFYGNTLIVKGEDGTESKVIYKPDHNYSVSDPKTGDISGTWAMEGDKLCMTQTQPAPPPGREKLCVPSPIGKTVGDTWNDTLPDGSKITLLIVEGA